ncbi:epidermal growth factor receptor kinase substrate 8-like protein 3b [Cetorhinus maximus]
MTAMYGDYGNRRIPDYDDNDSQINGFTPEKSPLQRSNTSKRPSAKAIYEQRKAYALSITSADSLVQYHVEHLTTCELDSKNLRSVDHCIMKLKLLHAQGKIWGQDMFLQLTDTTFKLADIMTKDYLEVFPIEAIQDSQAILNSCGYNSVLAISIKGTTKGKTSVYLFQCEEVSADLIQAEIDNKIRGKKGTQGNQDVLRNNLESMLSQHPQPPYGKSAMLPPQDKWMPLDPVKPLQPAMSEHGSWTEQQSRAPSEYASSIYSKISNDDREKEIPHHSTELKYMDILNHILDDIELFSDKITQAIGSKPQKKKKKSKKRIEGLPPESEFEDCLQKIKYAFNLVSMVENELKNPSTADMVHSLFKIIEFVQENNPKPNLAQKVIVPFLIPGALQILNSLTSAEEKDIWKSLGKTWKTTRSDWPDGASYDAYVPKFSSGWNPPSPQMSSTSDQQFSNESAWLKEQMEDSPSASFAKSQEDPQLAKAMYDFMKRNTRELSVTKGDVLQVLEASKQWWKVKDVHGDVGYVPSNIMLLTNEEESLPLHVGNHPGSQYSPYADSPDLTRHSTPKEVTIWLQKKGFSRDTVASLGVLTGSQLLSLTKEELKMITKTEGHIVHNMVHGGAVSGPARQHPMQGRN